MMPYLRLEMLRLLRDPGYLLMSVISPLTMFLIFTNIKTGGGHDGPPAYSMVGLAGFGAVGAVLNSGVGIAEDKPLGWIRQLRLLPLRPVEVIVGRALCAMAVALPPILAVCLAGGLVDGVSLPAGRWAAVLLLLWLGVLPIAVLAMGLGYLFDAQKAQMSAMIGYLGLSIVGGLWFPISSFPHWLWEIARMSPLNRYGELSWRMAFDGGVPLTALGLLACWSVPFAALALYGYRRSVRTA